MDNQAYPNLKDLLILFLILLLFMLGTGILAGFYQFIPNVRITPLIQSLQNLLAYSIACLGAIWYAVRKIKKRQLKNELDLNFDFDSNADGNVGSNSNSSSNSNSNSNFNSSSKISSSSNINFNSSSHISSNSGSHISSNSTASFSPGFNKFPLWLIPILILTTLSMIVWLERLSSLIPMPDSVAEFFDRVFKNDFFSVIMLSIAAPILEETLCRGIVLQGLLKNYPARKAIIYSALFFALIHLNPWQSIPAFFAGLFLGWVYYKTKSVIPGMIVHCVVNTTAVLSMFLPKEQQDMVTWFSTPVYILVCIIAAIIFIAGCWFIQKKIPANTH